MKIIRSKYAGACYGVERALSLVDEAANLTETVVHTLGPLIHNPQVVSELKRRGVEEAATVAEIDEGVVVIRSHGVEPAIIRQAEAKGLQVVDATCPHVSKAHQAARELRELGYSVMVVGERGHPEVEGIHAYAGSDAMVVQDPGDLPEVLPSDKIGIVVQTTQAASVLDAIVEALRARGIEPEVRNTICFATKQRQQTAVELAERADVMVVVGGRNSGNTTRLAQLCREVCAQTHHIENASELNAEWFVDAELVGITAGASTPENQIIAVEKALKALGEPV
ncbi:MAG TPA: 4-hydroxy-3-methylbut-2-enyl diphosphate reductase [Coriobacteriia bacterium]|nr:4-hydroxy-3-methylbut-2-enyl diphosphate reductase [Coriobacteriia bacterium]